MDRIVFFNIAWMKRYQGVVGDTPVGGGSYVRQHGFGAEIFNFQHFRNRMYGFVEAGWTPLRSINITKLGARRTDQSVRGILVVWVARHRDHKKTVVVGWCENGRVHRDRQASPPGSHRQQPDGQDAPYFAEADTSDCLLIPEDMRDFQILRAPELQKAKIAPANLKDAGGIGQSNIYYGQDWYGNQIKPGVLAYVAMWKRQQHLSVPITGYY
jgi:5-methylcytosine-specific restriction protein A